MFDNSKSNFKLEIKMLNNHKISFLLSSFSLSLFPIILPSQINSEYPKDLFEPTLLIITVNALFCQVFENEYRRKWKK
jgi:hypothetical protein